ncbi:hypothetical protein [Virgibacillus ihumii]|uniref:hypothetical protein n=1 Tax=Virgibacillus ihumii TaxID=2686091 RepID=UPI00157E21C7|nr:hypothetical protein [Virgibacillus ihumii]
MGSDFACLQGSSHVWVVISHVCREVHTFFNKQFWQKLRSNDYSVPPGNKLNKLTNELKGFLGEPVLRDKIAYPILSTWLNWGPRMREGHMKPAIPFYSLINILIPSVLVYWRKYSKWYLPFQYLLTVTIGNSIALLMVSLVTNADFVFWPILVLNITNLILGWFPVLIVVKIIKSIFEFMDNRSS